MQWLRESNQKVKKPSQRAVLRTNFFRKTLRTPSSRVLSTPHAKASSTSQDQEGRGQAVQSNRYGQVASP
jgi:hypothetical protein